MSIVRDRALLLRRTPYAESSLVAQVFTRSQGRLHLMAKGAFRRTSRYYCVLDLFDTLEIEASTRRESDLALLRVASVRERRRAPRRDLAAYKTGLQMLELCDLAVRPGQPDEELFDLLEWSLNALEEDPERSPLPTLIEFELGFLQSLGLAPALTRCASCGKEAPPVARGPEGADSRVAFSAGAGGRLCLECARSARSAGKRVGTLPESLLQDADLLSGRQLLPIDASNPAPRGVTWSDSRWADLGRFVERFMDYHLETTPRSRRDATSGGSR